MFCKQCGTQLQQNAQFCNKCGGSQNQQAAGYQQQSANANSESIDGTVFGCFLGLVIFLLVPALLVSFFLWIRVFIILLPLFLLICLVCIIVKKS